MTRASPMRVALPWGVARTLGVGAALITGCAGARPVYDADPRLLALPAGIVAFQGGSGPMSYPASAGGAVMAGPPVQGSRCQRGVSLPILGAFFGKGAADRSGAWLSVGWGHGAYADVVSELLAGQPAGTVLSDVRADLRTRMILSVYREQCLVLTATLLRPRPAADAPPPT